VSRCDDNITGGARLASRRVCICIAGMAGGGAMPRQHPGLHASPLPYVLRGCADASHISRVAIVDFDVHHGNGTADIAARREVGVHGRVLVPHHRYHMDCAGTVVGCMPAGIRHPLTHIPARRHHACQDSRRELGLEPDLLFLSTHEHPLYPMTGAVDDEGGGNTNAVRGFILQHGTDSDAWRRVYEERVLPCLAQYAPDLVIISAGFDAHSSDPLANCELEARDYEWVTREIVRCSNGGRAGGWLLPIPDPSVFTTVLTEICHVARGLVTGVMEASNGPPVSVLEGGYDIESLQDCAVHHVQGLLQGRALHYNELASKAG
jgi:acetoin utilization deacetylase AcuC-like enzyme